MITFKPHPPPLEDWPEHVKRIYLEGCKRIDRCREQLQPDGIVPIPFRCVSCEEQRDDLAMMTGDGLPLCVKCLGFVPDESMVGT